MIDEATAIKLKAIELSDNTIVKCNHAMSKDIEEHEKIRHNCFAPKIDEVVDSNKECLLIAYIGLIDLLFCKYITTSVTVDELLKIIDTWQRLI